MPGSRWKLEARAEAEAPRHGHGLLGGRGGRHCESRLVAASFRIRGSRSREGLGGFIQGRQAGKLAAARFAAELDWREGSASTRRMGRCWGWDRLGLEPLGVMFRQIAARYDSR